MEKISLVATDLQELISLSPDPIIAVNRAGIIVMFNIAAEKLLGYSGEEVIGRISIKQIFATADQARFVNKLLYTSPDRNIQGHETQLLSKKKRIIDIRLSAKLIVRDGEEVGSIGFFHDLTESKKVELKLKSMSITDSLTGLYNQRHFHAVLETEIERAKRHFRPLNLICTDLDNFKQVNDALGHLEGDKALRFVANTIRKVLRKTDMAFRYGGDEFMLLLLETCSEEAEAIGRRLKESFDKRWAEEWSPKRGCPLVSISMGIAEFDRKESPKGLIRRADFLMYEAKNRDRR
ncbi:putative Diguanylate cyclase [Georgfuchsia toluolica]|uniref:diguanylate cyclase n=1 Tax=Georgfuchsia toluolica TaxID=424218 RepID=A0A916NA08_9PROT|nr:sensor domain-containing diguanylate cyclase [Georgfuchsia toluolica]CAG4884710.1 putative Diguanylate cyclase [Georgfuchsia toluolica]